MDVYDFTPVQYPADDVTAEWQTTHFNFHDIDENVPQTWCAGTWWSDHDSETAGLVWDWSNEIPMDDEGVMAPFLELIILG